MGKRRKRLEGGLALGARRMGGAVSVAKEISFKRGSSGAEEESG